MEKINFVNQYRKPLRFMSEVGSPEVVTLKPVFDDRGVWHLVAVGRKDLYGEIQSHADSVDINILLQRFKNGDIDVFSRVQGIYGDFTDMPETMIDAVNRIEQGRLSFMALPAEVREYFGNSFETMLSAMGSTDFMDKMAEVFAPKDITHIEENNEEGDKR